MISSIIQWVATAALNWLAKGIAKAIQRYRDQLAKDHQEGVVNEENIKNYEEALNRKARIDAATDLLNRG